MAIPRGFRCYYGFKTRFVKSCFEPIDTWEPDGRLLLVDAAAIAE
jgi:hypothetical protein